jgi:hypothetical protein
MAGLGWQLCCLLYIFIHEQTGLTKLVKFHLWTHSFTFQVKEA